MLLSPVIGKEFFYQKKKNHKHSANICSYAFGFSFLYFYTQARALLQTASSLAPHMYEPHFNFATISDKVFFLY